VAEVVLFTNGRSTAQWAAIACRPDRVIDGKGYRDAMAELLNTDASRVVKLDDDMILHPMALKYMREMAATAGERLAYLACNLWEDYTRQIRYGVKIYNVDAVRSIGGFQHDPETGKCDSWTNAALERAGYIGMRDTSIVGVHAAGTPDEHEAYMDLWRKAGRPGKRWSKASDKSVPQYKFDPEQQYRMSAGLVEALNESNRTPFSRWIKRQRYAWMDPVTIACFAWQGLKRGPVVRTNDTAMYLRRLHEGLRRNTSLPWRMVFFADQQHMDVPVPDGVDKREFDPPSKVGCMPKLYAHSPDACLSGRVVIMDIDTVITGDMDPVLAWRGYFCSRADERDMARGILVSGGGMSAFHAGTHGYLWDALVADPHRFATEYCRKKFATGCERVAFKCLVKNQSFWNVEIPGLMCHSMHCPDILDARLPDARIPFGCKMVVYSGKGTPGEMPDNEIRRLWESYDQPEITSRGVVANQPPSPRPAMIKRAARRPRMPEPGVALKVDTGVECPHCQATHGHQFGHKITNSYPHGRRRMICGRCNRPFITIIKERDAS
jgi:hypothetical protein